MVRRARSRAGRAPIACLAVASARGAGDRAARVSRWDRRPDPSDWRWWVGGVGKVLITIGLLMFGFVAYQLWGTGIETARAQSALEGEFEALRALTPSTTLAPTTTTTPPDPSSSTTLPSTPTAPAESTTTTAPIQVLPPIEEGDPIAFLEIPRIGSDHWVVAGVSKEDLKKGPGHYPETPMPGQLGNAAIAGHRTTFGQPFHNVDRLEVGDEIIVTTYVGRFVYRVTGSQIVSPNDYQVVATTDPDRATLTLTSCHPKWSAKQRIIVTAELDETASAAPVGAPTINYGRPLDDVEPGDAVVSQPSEDDPTISSPAGDAPGASVPGADPSLDHPAVDQGIADAFSDGWFSDPDANPQVALWGLVLAAIGFGSYLLARRFRRLWVAFVVGAIPFVVALYFFYQNVNRLLPPNL